MLTPAQPVSSSIFFAACGVVTSPLPMTGIVLHRLHHRADAGQVNRAAKSLLARPAVNKNRRHAGVFQRARQVGRGDVLVVPAQPHLGGDRNLHRARPCP